MDLERAAHAAYTFAAPLLEIGRVRGRAFAAGQQPGTFTGRRDLASPSQRGVTMPNNDTVYASAFVDLRGGPATFRAPPSPGRYASLQIMDFYSNNIAVLSPRTIGEQGGTFRVVGPGQAATSGDIVSPTPWIWALVRVLVDGPADLDAALAVRDHFGVAAAEVQAPPAPFAPPAASGVEQLVAAAALMRENPPLPQDAEFVRALAPLGFDRASRFDPARLTPAQAAAVEAGVAAARARARNPTASGQARGGWLYNHPQTGVFGRDYDLRAAVATFGLAAFPPAEAVYLRAIAPDGSLQFEGPGPWRLSFAADQRLPVESFWSATMYAPTPTGQYFLIDNAMQRYAIGDRTPGLRYGSDGSLDIWIGRGEPDGARASNWLPAPASGPFAVVLRGYLPKAELLDGRYEAPPILPI